jgi:uncharacterized OB-fold protein
MPLTPQPDDISDPYWAAARVGRLCLPACSHCGGVDFPPYPRCSTCFGDVTWTDVSGDVHILGVARITRSFSSADLPIPYDVMVARLDQHPSVLLWGSRPVGDVCFHPGDAACVAFCDASGWPCLTFEPRR